MYAYVQRMFVFENATYLLTIYEKARKLKEEDRQIRLNLPAKAIQFLGQVSVPFPCLRASYACALISITLLA